MAALLTVTLPATAAPPVSAGVHALPACLIVLTEGGSLRRIPLPVGSEQAANGSASEHHQFWPSPDIGVNRDRELRYVFKEIREAETSLDPSSLRLSVIFEKWHNGNVTRLSSAVAGRGHH
jgi:hypothetical protein